MKVIIRASGLVVAAIVAIAMPRNADGQRLEESRRDFEAMQQFSDLQMVVREASLAKELGLSEAQGVRLREIVDQANAENREIMGSVAVAELRSMTPEQHAARNAKMRIVHEVAQKEVELLLSPAQRERIAQIAFQRRLQISGMARGLTMGAIGDELGITANQQARLQQVEQQVQGELETELESLRAEQRKRVLEARKKVLKVLTPEQQVKFDKLLGAPVEFEDRMIEYGVGGISSRIRRGGFGGVVPPRVVANPPAAPAVDPKAKANP